MRASCTTRPAGSPGGPRCCPARTPTARGPGRRGLRECRGKRAHVQGPFKGAEEESRQPPSACWPRLLQACVPTKVPTTVRATEARKRSSMGDLGCPPLLASAPGPAAGPGRLMDTKPSAPSMCFRRYLRAAQARRLRWASMHAGSPGQASSTVEAASAPTRHPSHRAADPAHRASPRTISRTLPPM